MAPRAHNNMYDPVALAAGWGLREEGIRTKLISEPDALANDLRDAVYSVSNVRAVIKAALERANAVRT